MSQTLDFSSGHDLTVWFVGPSTVLGSVLTARIVVGILSVPLPLVLSLSLSLSKMNKQTLKTEHRN